jgi:peptidoglycan/LPS O-acetylase OafA/YrhL
VKSLEYDWRPLYYDPAVKMSQPFSTATEPLLRREMPELDTIRGLAILGVLLYHGLYWQVDLSRFSGVERLLLTSMWMGRLGVDLFFVLSGFLISGILLDSRGRREYYKRFYVRRALRIFPIYLAIIAILAFLKYVPLSFTILSVLYLSNLTPLWGIPIAYPVLWSLAVEEHFYFLWPAAVRNLQNKILILLCLTVIVVTPLSRLLTYILTVHGGFVNFTCNEYTWNSLDGLACGAAFSLLLREYQPKRSTLWLFSYLLIIIATAIWILGFPFGILTRQTPVGAALQVVPWHLTFTAMLSIFLLIGTGPWRTIVRIGSLRFLGYISYGLYLIHLLGFACVDRLFAHFSKHPSESPGFTLLILRLMSAGSISIGLAFLSRKYFEERFLQLKSRLSSSSSVAAEGDTGSRPDRR